MNLVIDSAQQSLHQQIKLKKAKSRDGTRSVPNAKIQSVDMRSQSSSASKMAKPIKLTFDDSKVRGGRHNSIDIQGDSGNMIGSSVVEDIYKNIAPRVKNFNFRGEINKSDPYD